MARKSMAARLIIINVAAFVVIRLLALFMGNAAAGADAVLACVELPADFGTLLRLPWTLLTYMFIQYDLLHILFNMLWLYCFSIIFTDHFTERSLLVVYLAGGLSGAVFYLVANALMPGLSHGLLGSSAAVLAVAAATVVRAPNYHINLFLIGMVKIKWVAIACLAFALLSVGQHNIGGHLAHLGGITAGTLYALNARYGWFGHRATRRNIRHHSIRPATHPDTLSQAEIEHRLDELLIKVRRSGYNSLNDSEKAALYDLSKRIKI